MKIIYIPIFSIFLVLIGIVGTIQLAYAGVIPLPLDIEKRCEPSSQTEDGTITWTIMVANPNPVALLGQVEDTRHGLIFVGVIPPSTILPPFVFVEPNLPAGTYTDTALVITGGHLFEDRSTAVCIVEERLVGGNLLPIESTSLLLAGVQTTAIWMLPAIAGIVAGAYFVRTRMNKDN